MKDRLAERFIRRLVNGRPVHRVLDVSTGNGRYAVAAARCLPGAAVVATDVQPEPPEPLRPWANLRYLTTAQLAVDEDASGFDLIILRHVLEHTYDPRELLTDLRNRLAPGGELYIEVPNLACAWAPWAGRYFPGYYAPFHVLHFTKDTLQALVDAIGLSGDVRPMHMPMVGNILSRRWGWEETFPVKLIGIALFPLQLLSEVLLGGPSALRIRAKRIDAFAG